MKAAFFDFDDTLTHGDTLPLWLATCRDWPITIFAYAIAIMIGGFIPAPGAVDWRGRVKACLLWLVVRRYPADWAALAGKHMKSKIRWRAEMVERLKWHAAQGHKVVVVTGAATIYVPALLEGLPVDEVIGTKLETVGFPKSENNELDDLPIGLSDIGRAIAERHKTKHSSYRLTGRILGVNCVRAAKAEIVRNWLAVHQPEETWGYGNDPHDLPMLALLDHRTIV